MQKIMIGITTSRKKRDHERYDSNLLGDYSLAVSSAGGLPMLIPNETPLEDLRELLGSMRGIMLSGGGDIYTDMYGVADDGNARNRSRTRDTLEKTLVTLAVEMDIPLLGICRGHQMLNAALGGTLYTDIETQFPTDIEHSQPTTQKPGHLVHEVNLIEGSRLSGILEKLSLRVNSRHHQAVNQVAPGLVVTARASDGLIEGIEHPGMRFCVGVQWHPESLLRLKEHRAIFEGFISAANG